MKREKLLTLLWSTLIAFSLGFGGAACIVTGFRMIVELSTVAIWCAVAALGFGVCFCLPLGWVPIATFSLVGGLMWDGGDLATGLESLLYRLTRQYDRGYKWGVIQLNNLSAETMEATLVVALTMLAVLIALCISWAVCRRRSALPGGILSLLMLGSCLVVTDTVPDTIWLFLLFFGIVLLLLTQTVRRQDEERGNKLTALMALPMLTVLLGMFLLLPEGDYKGEEYPRQLLESLKRNNEQVAQFFGETVEVGTTGSSVDSGSVNLRTVGVRLPSQAEILQMLTNYDDTIYLRGRALDQYDGLTWTDSGTSTANLTWPASEQLGEGGEVMITTRYAHRMLYLPYYVQSKDLTDMTRGLENTGKLSQYSFTCQTFDPNNESFLAARDATYDPAEWEAEFSKHIHLSEEVLQWAKPLAEQITAGEATVYGKAQAIAKYVRSTALYDTNTKRMPSTATDFAKWFLESGETGYCVHFATATTVLLQAAGIPARYITGYMANMQAAYVEIVQSKEAHAWAEFWLPGYGWMLLESTPPDLRGQETETTATEPQTVVPGVIDPNALQPTGPVTGNPGTATPNTPAQTEPQASGSQTGEPPAEPPDRTWLIPTILLTLGGICILLGQWKLRVFLRAKGCRKGNTNRQALSCWQEMERLHRYLDEPPEERILELAEKAKFSPHTLTEAEVKQFHLALRQARRELRQKPWPCRLWHRVILALY